MRNENQEYVKTTAMIAMVYEEMGDAENCEIWTQKAFNAQKNLGNAHPAVAAALQGLQGLSMAGPAPAQKTAQKNAVPQQVSTQCGSCSKPGNFRCSRCRVVSYCSKDCQRKAWPIHKNDCNTEPK